MLKIIIADDEFRVIKLIKKIIKWDELGLVNSGEAKNGLEAFELIKSECPQIVITDIRMPGMDGLRLVEKTREIGLETDFIIVSGYKEFEFAKNAIHFGVEEYLVKPINEIELNEALRRLRDRYLEEKGRLENEQMLQLQIERNRQILHDQFMNKLINEPDFLGESQYENNLHNYQISFSEGFFQAFIIKVDTKDSERNAELIVQVTEKLLPMIQQLMEQEGTKLILSTRNASIIALMNFLDKDQMNQNIRYTFEQARNWLDNYGNLTITFGLGTIETNICNISQSIKAAKDSILLRIVVGVNRIIEDSNNFIFENDAWKTLSQNDQIQFAHLIEGMERGAINEWLVDAYSKLNFRGGHHPRILFGLSTQIGYLFFQTTKKLGIESSLYDEDSLAMQLENVIRTKDFYLVLSDYILTKIDSYLQVKQIQDEKPIRLAKHYISQHYGNPISLEEIANEIHFNPAYFSVVFKKETGINFSDYLINFRIEKSKELLINTNDSIKVISEMVSYKDSKYYSKVFTKIVGITPSEYRRLHA